MSTELVPIPVPHLPAFRQVDLVEAFLAGRNPRTLDAYSRDLADFATFLGMDGPGAAVGALVSAGHGPANGWALRYKAHLVDRGLATATIARRLAALRSVVKLARILGRISWALDVESPRTQSYRDTRGPGRDGFRAIVRAARSSATPKALRDHALVRLLHDLALRRAEAIALDLEDVDLEAGTIQVVGKGRTEAIRMTLPGPVRDALAAWLEARGREPGPVFVRLDRAARAPGRLTGRAVHQIVGQLGLKASLPRPVRPHGLRHSGITTALDAFGGDVRTVRKFSRHSKVETLLVYDDNRSDVAGEVARRVSEE
jgi:integrase/recombinase XerC